MYCCINIWDVKWLLYRIARCPYFRGFLTTKIGKRSIETQNCLLYHVSSLLRGFIAYVTYGEIRQYTSRVRSH